MTIIIFIIIVIKKINNKIIKMNHYNYLYITYNIFKLKNTKCNYKNFF